MPPGQDHNRTTTPLQPPFDRLPTSVAGEHHMRHTSNVNNHSFENNGGCTSSASSLDCISRNGGSSDTAAYPPSGHPGMHDWATTATEPIDSSSNESIPPPTTTSFEFGSALNDDDDDADCVDGNGVDDDDDDDSYHDLQAVMALVANSNINWSDDTLRRMSAGSVTHLPPEPLSSFNEECKVEITEETYLPPQPPPLPRFFASTVVVAAPTEATVLETTTSPHSARRQQTNEDARLATRLREEDDLLLAMKLSAYEGGGNSTVSRNGIRHRNWESNGDHQEATVVAIADDDYFHDGPLLSTSAHNDDGVTATAVHAEWIGQDYSPALGAALAAEAEPTGTLPHPNSATTTDNVSGAVDAAAASVVEDDNAREALVIDSAPLEKQDDSTLRYTEEARVLVDATEEDNTSNADLMDRKPAARPRTTRRRSRTSEQQAEVLAIQERGDVHPTELVQERAFRAELVGTDSSYTVAIPSSSPTTSAVADRAAVMSSSRNRIRHGGATDSIHATPPQAVAFVETATATSESSTAAAAGADTVAAAVADNVDDFSVSDLLLADDGPVEEAEVFIPEDGDSSFLDRKPAAVDSPSRRHHHITSYSRNSLPVIAEQNKDAIALHGIHDTDEQAEAPELCGSNIVTEALGPHTGAASVVPSFATSSSIEASTDVAAVIVENAEFALVNDSYGEPVTLVEPELAEASTANEGVNLASNMSYGSQPRRAFAATPGSSEVERMNGGDPELVREVGICPNDSTVSFTSLSVADVVDIQEDDDIHPADLTASLETSAPAELVRSASLPEVHSTDGAPLVASAVLEISSPQEAAVLQSKRGEVEETAATVATAFLDPHQPFVNESGNSVEIPTVTKTVDVGPSDGSLANMQPTASSESEGHVVDADAYDTEWLQSGTPANQAFSPSNRETSSTTVDSESGHTASSQRTNIQAAATANIQMISRGTTMVIDALFGVAGSPFVPKRTRSTDDEYVRSVVTRTLLPWSVIHQKSSGMWIATLQTNQRALDKNDVAEASKSLRAFSMPSENQALSLARTWTPPRMHPFADHSSCHICKAKFAILRRRACHCRNCGVCVCKDCVVPWPAKMIPDTYNIKKEHVVNACLSCNWLSNAFRRALLEGNRDQVVALHSTGNVNLHSPFANVKGELFYPVHCAVLGGSLDLLKFLVDDNCCPIKSVRVAGIGKDSAHKYTPIVTSKGRSLLGIAMENENLPVLRYLVVEKGIMLASEKDVTQELLCRNFEKLLRCVNEEFVLDQPRASYPFARAESEDGSHQQVLGSNNFEGLEPITPTSVEGIRPDRQQESSLNEEARDFGAVAVRERRRRSSRGSRVLNSTDVEYEECIICFDRKIDCVATPCGHQICCLVCSENLDARCPVCSCTCSFMRIYKT